MNITFHQSLKFMKQGMQLVHKAPLFLILSIFLSIAVSVDEFYSFPGTIVLMIVFVLAYIGYSLTLPYLYQNYKDKKQINFQVIIKETSTNIRRAFFPSILIFLVAVLGFAILMPIIGIFLGGFSNWNIFFIEENTFGLHNVIFIVLTSLVLAFFVFTSIYFSIEQDSLFTSLKKSFILARKNLAFVMVAAIMSLVYGFLSFFFEGYSGTYRVFIYSIVTEYIAVVITAGSLCFYNSLPKHAKK